jgi:hypothetical protein
MMVEEIPISYGSCPPSFTLHRRKKSQNSSPPFAARYSGTMKTRGTVLLLGAGYGESRLGARAQEKIEEMELRIAAAH